MIKTAGFINNSKLKLNRAQTNQEYAKWVNALINVRKASAHKDKNTAQVFFRSVNRHVLIFSVVFP